MSDQLPLNIQLRDDSTWNSFYVREDNQAALNALSEMAKGQGEWFLYIWGHTGAGRTHLLQAASHEASIQGIPSLYIPLKSQAVFSEDVFQGAEGLPLVCIDDLQDVAGQPQWEEALFHLFNRIQMQKGRLLVAADVPPVQLSIALLDLKSRLSSGVVYQVHTLTDEQKIQTLQLRASQRGLHLPQSVGAFLLHRCPRNMSELFSALEKLDKASLAKQRRLTIPFVKQILDV